MSVGPVRVMEAGVVLKLNVKEVNSQCMWIESANSNGTTSCVILLSHTYCIVLGTNTLRLWNYPGTALLNLLITGLVFVCTLPAM